MSTLIMNVIYMQLITQINTFIATPTLGLETSFFSSSFCQVFLFRRKESGGGGAEE